MAGGGASCVSADVAAAYVARALADAERCAVDEHIDACADCRRLISEAVRETGDSSGGFPVSAGALPRGARLGPYVIEGMIDAGGMGVVYAARDGRLGRAAAIKAVGAGGAGNARGPSSTEAQAMARLSHPNVVAVYDVIERGGEQYLAMELVRGRNLRQWLGEQRRRWSEVIDVFVAAGEGLAAVHDAGLVHRDVKPSNLLLGDDGRVRLADFGLAVASDHGNGNGNGHAGDRGTAGTPGYRAPEQRTGGRAEARSDQYAFCVALHEALYGGLPGRGAAHGNGVPRRIRRAVERGLRTEPAERFPSIHALLVEIRAGRRAARRSTWRAIGIVAALVVATAAAIGYRALDARAAMAACEAGGSLAGIWDRSRQDEIARALRATAAPYAATAWQRVHDALDDWALRYGVEHHAACAATWNRRAQSVAQLAARLDCLAERRGELRGVTDQLARADATTASYAVTAARLTSPATCTSIGPATRAPGADPGREAAREMRARVRALIVTGHARDALPLARAALAEAERAGNAAGRADALWQLGWIEGELSELDASETHLLAAVTAAERAGMPWTRAEAWIRLLRLEHLLGRYDRLEVYRAQAEAAVEAAGNAPQQRAMVLQFVGTMFAAQGRRAEAKVVLLAALEADPDAPAWDRGSMLESLALADEIGGDVRGGLALLQQSRSLIEQGLGPRHPRVAYSYESIAVAWFDLLEPARARAEMAHALEIFEPALGTHRSVAVAHDIMGLIALEGGDVAAAGDHHRRALRMWNELGLTHPREAYTHLGLSQVALASGDLAAAVAEAEQARSLGQRVADPKDRALITLQLALALDASRRDPARVRALASEAAAAYTSVLRSPRDDRDLARATRLAAAR